MEPGFDLIAVTAVMRPFLVGSRVRRVERPCPSQIRVRGAGTCRPLVIRSAEVRGRAFLAPRLAPVPICYLRDRRWGSASGWIPSLGSQRKVLVGREEEHTGRRDTICNRATWRSRMKRVLAQVNLAARTNNSPGSGTRVRRLGRLRHDDVGRGIPEGAQMRGVDP